MTQLERDAFAKTEFLGSLEGTDKRGKTYFSWLRAVPSPDIIAKAMLATIRYVAYTEAEANAFVEFGIGCIKAPAPAKVSSAAPPLPPEIQMLELVSVL